MSDSLKTISAKERDNIQDALYMINRAHSFKYSKIDNLILVLGNAGSGKSYFMQSIAGNSDSVQHNTHLHATLPNLIENTEHNVFFCEVPDFSNDTMQTIIGNYVTKSILSSANFIKLILVIDFIEVKKESLDLIAFVKYIITLVKHLDKFKYNIGLIVTIANKNYKESDSNIIQNEVKEHLEKWYMDLYNNQRLGSLHNNYLFTILFANLYENNINLKRLGILRSRNDFNHFTHASLLDDNKESLKYLLYNHIHFIKHDINDFNYNIPANADAIVNDLIVMINDNIFSDLKIIWKQIKMFYQNLEKEVNDINDLHKTFILAQNHLSYISKVILKCTQTQCLMENIIQAITTLNIKDLYLDFADIESYGEFLEYINLERKDSNAFRPVKWNKGLTDIVRYLNDSHKWYQCLIFLDTWLSNYNTQWFFKRSTTIENERQNKMKSLQHSLRSRDIVKSMNLLRDFVDMYSYAKLKRFDSECDIDFVNIELNDSKLKFLNMILNEALFSDTTVSYTKEDDKIIIKGYYVFLDSLHMFDASGNYLLNARFIEIYALRKLFLDSGLYNKDYEAQISIIAPEWEICPDGVIDKNIVISLPINTHNSMKTERWKSGGNFIGISQRVVNENDNFFMNVGFSDDDDKVYIYTSYDICVSEIMINSLEKHSGDLSWFNNRCKIDIEYSYFSEGTCVFYKNCTFPFHFQKAGDITFVVTEMQSKFKSDNRQEEARLLRNGCKGQNGRINENCIDFKFTRSLNQYNLSDVYTFHPKKTTAAEVPIFINKYKKYVRENLIHSLRKSTLIQFLDEIDQNDFYNNLLDFFNELQDLEEHFYKLKDKIPFLPFYESILKRIERHVLKLQDSGDLNEDNKEVLRYLHISVLSKIRCLKDDVYMDYSRNLAKYLTDSIDRLNQIKNSNNYNDYQNKLENNVKEADDIVQNKLAIEIDPIIAQINKNLEKLISETEAKIDQAEQDKKQHEIDKENAKKLYSFKWIMGIAKIASAALSFLGPVGMALGAVAQGTIGIAENVLTTKLSPESTEASAEIPESVQKALECVQKSYKEEQSAYNKTLVETEKMLEEEIKSNDAEPLLSIKKEVTEARKNLDEEDKNGKINCDSDSMARKAGIKKKLTDFVKKKKEKFIKVNKPNAATSKDKKDKKSRRTEKMLTHVDTAISMVEMGVDLYGDINSHRDDMDNFDLLIAADNLKIAGYQLFKEEIYNVMMPLSENVGGNLKNATKSLARLSRVSLDIAEREIKKMLDEAMGQLADFTEEFVEIQRKLVKCFNDLKELMELIIQVHRGIQSYKETQEFAKYIAIFNLDTTDDLVPSRSIQNKRLNDIVNNLTLITQRSIFLRKYENAINSFKQHVFPIADHYLSNIFMSTLFQDDKINNTVKNVVNTLRKLRTSLDNHISGSNPFSYKRHKTARFGCGNTPFFVWNYAENKNTIRMLLQGIEVTLKSDIRRGIDVNAIKFTQIGIRFRLSDKARQSDFDNLLKNSRITMKHLGTSYYRCDEKIYTITTEEIVVINYDFYKDCIQGPHDPNAVYQDLAINSPSLSPYAMWSIQITSKNIDTLFNKYKNEEMTLELEGKGDYYELGQRNDNVKLCSENMDKYYVEDNSVAPAKYINLNSPEEMYEETRITHQNDNERKPRNVHESDLIEDLEKNMIVTNNGCSTAKSSFINNLINVIGHGFTIFRYWMPRNYMTQWLSDYNDNVYTEKYHIVNTNHQIDMKLEDVQYLHKYFPNESANKDSPNIENVATVSLFCSNANLFFLDSLIRWKNGTKHKQQRSILGNDFVDIEYVHKLAYRGYLYEDN